MSAEVYCPALAADGERWPYAVPAESHPPNPDDAAIVRLVRERDAADDGTRHTLDSVLAEHGIERGSLQV